MNTVLTPAPQTETTSSPVSRSAPRYGSPRRRTPTDPGERRIWLILLGTLVLAAFCVRMFLQQPRFRHTDTPIGEIQLGANVPGSNPSEADDLTFGDSIDPDTWKMLRLTAQQGDGTLVEISLLRPDSWLAERNAVEGRVVDGLEFGRLGVVGDATVETISPCPPIRPGPGRTVTGIYRHFGQKVLDLRTANGEEIGVTPDHRFWSADRREFVQAGDLKPGETLNLLDGTTTVISIKQRPSGEPVYTLEVQVEHVFHVAKSGVLVHNCNTKLPGRDDLGRFTSSAGGHTADAARGIAAHKNYRNALGDGYQFEVKLPSGKRVDAVDFDRRIVRELKPDNPRALQDGRRQLERYRKELEEEFGGNWEAFLDTYVPWQHRHTSSRSLAVSCAHSVSKKLVARGV